MQGMAGLRPTYYIGFLSIQALETKYVGPDLARTTKQQCQLQVGVYCYMKNHRPWMGCHSFHMFCGCMAKVLQSCDIINTLTSCSSKPQSIQAVVPDLVRNAKPSSHPRDIAW